MKLIIKTESLLNILLPLQPIINDNHIMPILQNVRLDFTVDSIIATGNNLEVSCSNSVKNILQDKETSFCVNYTMLLSILKSLTDNQITLSIKKGHIDIIHKKGNFDLPTESSNEFPKQEIEKFVKKAKVSGTGFRSSLKVATKFILNDDLDAMASISISIAKKIFVRSTDRNRLFEEKIKGSGDAEDILISGKSALALFALLEDNEEDVDLRYNDNSINFNFDNKEIIVIQQKGNFPLVTFRKVLGAIDEAEAIKLDVKSFVTALKRVSIMSQKEKHSTVKLDITKKGMVISCESKTMTTKAEESLECKFLEKRRIGFNYRYLIEILSIFEKEPNLYLDSRNCLFIKQKKKIGALSPVMLNND